VFKLPEALVTLPKSHMQGIEAQAVLRPVHGLAIDSSVTHIRSKIDRLVGVSSAVHPAGKNVTNNYRWSSTFLGFDTVTRFVAPPATHGISLPGRFRRPERRGETGCSRPYA